MFGLALSGMSSAAQAQLNPQFEQMVAHYYYIDRNGKPVTSSQYRFAEVPDASIWVRVDRGGKCGLVNLRTRSETFSKYVLNAGSGCSEPEHALQPPSGEKPLRPRKTGLTLIRAHGIWGFADANGKVKISPRFVEATPFGTNGFARVKVNGRAYEFPSKPFGRWALNERLFAIPEVGTFGPQAIGKLTLTAQSSDGKVQWQIETDGFQVVVRLGMGPKFELAAISGIAEQFPGEGKEGETRVFINSLWKSLTKTWREPDAYDANQLASIAKFEAIMVNEKTYLDELEASGPDLDKAIAQMRSDTKQLLGGVSNPYKACPGCVY